MIAIHTSSGGFVSEWVSYCRENGIAYKEVDCFSGDIIGDLGGCDALLWHWAHTDYHASLFARQLIASVEAMGILVFPNRSTCWHYDDKLGQKYLLEAVSAPTVPTYVSYDKNAALEWVRGAAFPIVWKLRAGAGSQNVRLVRDRKEAARIVRKSFGQGWGNSRLYSLSERLWELRRDRSLGSFLNLGRGLARALLPHRNSRLKQVERHYVYFQEFVPDNSFDIRIVAVGARAFGIKRLVRSGDFRASGSGAIIYDVSQIPTACIRIAFEVAARIGAQCCAFDFVYRQGEWLIIEISYAFSPGAYRLCPGYWDAEIQWHEGEVSPERFIIEGVLRDIESRAHG